MTLRTHALSLAAIAASCAVSGFVFADGLKSQWKVRMPISNIVSDVPNDMTQFSAYELQKKIDALNASDLAKLVVSEKARLAVRKGKQIAAASVTSAPVVIPFGETDRVRSVKKSAKPVACARLHTHERAECLSRQAYERTVQYRENVEIKTALVSEK